MKTFNKLVRDRIPEIIASKGENPITRILENDEYVLQLKTKLQEESAEVAKTTTDDELIAELADVQEVIDAIVKVHNLEIEKIRQVQDKKRQDKGGFEKRLFLESTD